MTNPFAYVPFAIAAHGGSVDGMPASQLTMAGVSLLRASVALVRALEGRRAAILMPTSAAFFSALAACDGRAAVLIDPLAAPRDIAFQLADADVGAVFTVRALSHALPARTVHALLDDAPARATVIAGDVVREVVLTSHDTLRLDGAPDAPGSDDPGVIVYPSAPEDVPRGAVLTHRTLLAGARATVHETGLAAGDELLALVSLAHPVGLGVAGLAPLLAGARVRTMHRAAPASALELLESGQVTHLAGDRASCDGLLHALVARTRPLAAPALRVAMCVGLPVPRALQESWYAHTRIELRQG